MDPDLRRLALKQQGNITRQQLLDLGVGPGAIKYRVRHGKLFRSYPGVYGVGRPAFTPHERASAAVLACGPGAALSHVSALALWGFAGRLEAPFDVAVQADRRPKGIRTYQLRGLQRRDLPIQLGIRTTSPARTVLDCAPHQTERARARTVNDALISRHLTRSALGDVIDRNPRHPGAKLLQPFVGRTDGPTRSELEDTFAVFLTDHHLPRALFNVTVNGVEVDAYFPEHKLIVELDGWAYHSSRAAFEGDRTRDADALANGLATVRITHDRMTTAAANEADRLRRILSRASAPPEPQATP